jgi:hypothetical protein
MTVTVKSKTPLVVLPSARRQAGLKSGQQIEFKAADGVISIRPKLPAVDDEYTPEQRRIVDAQLAESLADVKAGRIRGPFSTHEEFIASLHKDAKRLNRKNAKRPAWVDSSALPTSNGTTPRLPSNSSMRSANCRCCCSRSSTTLRSAPRDWSFYFLIQDDEYLIENIIPHPK